MKSAVVATLMGMALAQGVTDKISPTDATPAGCSTSMSGSFEITVAKVTTAKRDLQTRGTCGANGALVMTLADGTTYDALGRTGYIASNYQFQFDAPPQAGAIYTSGFSVCGGSIMALGANTTFYRCLSGDFYNLYNVNWAPQCEAVSIIALPCGSADAASQGSDGQVSQGSDGQVVGTTVVATTIVTALSDGQPQVITTSVSVPVTSYYPTSAAVSQISDGQIQVPPPQTVTSVATGSTSVVITATSPAETATSATATGGSAAPGTSTVAASTVASATASGSASKSSSASASKSASITTSAVSTTATSPAATTSAPSSGSSRTAGSIGALAVGLLFAFVCL